MKIAVHTKELENARIDGTMVYIANVLHAMQHMIGEDDLYLYHTRPYNVHVPIAEHPQMHDRTMPHCPVWTQTRFARALWQDKCDVLWMPLHNMPYLRRKNMRTVVTIHDLAFKFYPQTFPTKDRFLINLCTDHAVRVADAVIAVSASTKKDLLAIYPSLREDQIHVIHHGFDPHVWQKHVSVHDAHMTLQRYGVRSRDYLIHVGAIQPRKNLTVLIDAFAQVKKESPQLKLVLVGGDGWLAQGIHAHIARSPYKGDIVVTGNIAFADVHILMQNASVCVLPSLYEGFGISGLEAMAAGVPVVAADNSCFGEVLGDGAIYFDAKNVAKCAEAIATVLCDHDKKNILIAQAQKRADMFSWEECARKTLDVLRAR
ncbi:MAG: glycosyltransferase family 1 protein [Parcubacteria group bacterium]|jgi:glycosyltransferase involved in cell wall biosynthesis